MSKTNAATLNDAWSPEVATGVRLRTSTPTTSGYTRVRTIIENRTAIVRTRAAALDAKGELAALPDTRQIDPYEHTPEQVQLRTQRLCACPVCELSGACWLCGGCGRVEAWIEILVTQRQHVSVSGEGAALERHEAVADPRDFERSAWPNPLLHEALYRTVPDEFAESLLPLLKRANERIVRVHVQTFVPPRLP